MSQSPPNEATRLTDQVFLITMLSVLAFGTAVIVYVIS
jgi:hypothetical protein